MTENIVPSKVATSLNLPISPKTSNGRSYKQSSVISHQQEDEEVFVKNGRSEVKNHNNTNGLNNIRSSSKDKTIKQHVT